MALQLDREGLSVTVDLEAAVSIPAIRAPTSHSSQRSPLNEPRPART